MSSHKHLAHVLAPGSLTWLILGCATPAPVAPGPIERPTAAPVASTETPREASSLDLRFDISAVDKHADPCNDFYDYACGGWRASHPIPPAETHWDRYAEMAAVNFERVRAIVEEASRAGADASPAEKRVGAYYTACMDESAIEARGAQPIRALLTTIETIRNRADAISLITDLQIHSVEALFGAYPEVDPDDSKQTIIWVDKAPLGLPDAGDYTKTDDTTVARRARYVEHLVRLFGLLAIKEVEAKKKADRLLAFETALAKKALTAVERRSEGAQHHPMTIDELQKRFGFMDWRTYFTKIGAPPITRVNVAQPAYLDAVNTAFAAKDLGALRDYLRVRVVRAAASVLPMAIEEELFDFRQRFLRGAKEMQPRWKRCLKDVNGDLGDDVGNIFVKRYFKEEARARMTTMVDALLGSYRADLTNSDWLSPPAREAALAKLAKGLFVIGASSRPRSYDDLRVDKDDPFGNAWRAQALSVKDEMAKVGKPTDRETFFESLPQELDGFGSKAKNATGFTAGFLQPPIFDPKLDDAVNYGGLGSVIGHELSHQFDDEGRKYDGDGNVRPWWSPEDVKRFDERARCFIDEYSHFHLEDGTALDGKLTLGENIADNGGIKLSYAALKPSNTGAKIDGFTAAQRFFLAWGQIRCENVTPEAARRQAETDPHAAGRWRVNGVVSNVPEFASAFSCQAGSPMAPAKRCAVW